MFVSGHAVIQVLTGYGQLPVGFDESVGEKTILGLPVMLKKVGRKPLPGGPMIGVTVTVPFDKLLNMAEYDIGELNQAIKSFYQINKNRCNFGFQAIEEENDTQCEFNISANNLSESTLDAFFRSLTGPAATFAQKMHYPHKSDWAVYINLDLNSEMVKNVTCFDIKTKDFFILDLSKNKWEKQPDPDDI